MFGIPIGWYLTLSAALFVLGAMGLILRRNVIVMFMCVEIMLNAVNLSFIAFARYHRDLDGHLFAFMVIAVAAAEAGIGLALIVNIYRHRRTLDVDDINLMQG